MTGITVHFKIRRMCATKHERDSTVLTAGNFVVASISREGVRAYSMASGELKWQFTGGIPIYALVAVYVIVNDIDEVWVDGSGNIRCCDYVLKEVYRISMSGEFLDVASMDSFVGNVGRRRFCNSIIMRRCATTSNVVIADKLNSKTWQINISNE